MIYTLEQVQQFDSKTKALERFKCKTDLFYLGKEYLGYDFVEEVHRPTCDFFVKKNPHKSFEDQDVIKDRLLLDPREHYKTTIDVADTIQWILVFPDIRISMFSGTEDLVKEIMEMVRRQFQWNEKFRELFPEHKLDQRKRESVFSFTTPARKNWRLREPTLSISTINSVSTGGHFEVMKFDDIVTTNNSDTEDMIEKVKNRVKSAVPLVVVGGYRDFIGTRYDHNDAYGAILKGLPPEKVVEKIPFGSITLTPQWKVFERQACEMPLGKDSKCLFPVHASGKKNFDYGELVKRYNDMGAEEFGCQYLNDPMWGQVGQFTENMLRSILIPMNKIPLITKHRMSGQIYKTSKVFITWDTAYSLKKQACRTVGAVGAFDMYGRLFLIDIEVGRFSPDEFVYRFMKLLRKWYGFLGRVGIEEAAGAPMIMPSLRASSINQRISLPIDWLPISPTKPKAERIFALIPLIKNNKFFINKDIPHLDEIIEEFTTYKPKKKFADIPDAVSLLLHYQGSVDITAPPLEEPQQPQSQILTGHETLGSFF